MYRCVTVKCTGVWQWNVQVCRRNGQVWQKCTCVTEMYSVSVKCTFVTVKCTGVKKKCTGVTVKCTGVTYKYTGVNKEIYRSSLIEKSTGTVCL
jgi:hypothetical protein